MITPTDYKCPLTREKCSKNCPWCIETEVEDPKRSGSFESTNAQFESSPGLHHSKGRERRIKWS